MIKHSKSDHVDLTGALVPTFVFFEINILRSYAICQLYQFSHYWASIGMRYSLDTTVLFIQYISNPSLPHQSSPPYSPHFRRRNKIECSGLFLSFLSPQSMLPLYAIRSWKGGSLRKMEIITMTYQSETSNNYNDDNHQAENRNSSSISSSSLLQSITATTITTTKPSFTEH